MKKNWREIVMVVMSWIVVWMAARGYESQAVQKLITMKARTEQIINAKGNPELQRVMKELGYDVIVKQPEKPVPVLSQSETKKDK